MTTYNENQVVELCEDVVQDDVTVARGTHGAIIDVYSDPSEGYEVEFVADDGTVIAQLTLLRDQIRPYERQTTSEPDLHALENAKRDLIT